jgi:hypothetical protein
MLQGLLHHLPAFAVGVVRDGAGIDNVNIRRVLEGGFYEAVLLKLPANGRRFGEIELAAQGVKGNFSGFHKQDCKDTAYRSSKVSQAGALGCLSGRRDKVKPATLPGIGALL